jgi:Super-infection exclusion protein B
MARNLEGQRLAGGGNCSRLRPLLACGALGMGAAARRLGDVTFAFLLFGLLALAGFISTTLAVFPLQKWVRYWIDIRREKGSVRDYIPHMTEQEREIIAYLLHKNEKTFTAESDGGYASTLASRGIVRVLARSTLAIDRLDVPMIIPDHVWAVLIEYKEQFSCKARMQRGVLKSVLGESDLCSSPNLSVPVSK